MASNIEKLGSTLHTQILHVAGANKKPCLELGTIASGMKLEPDSSPGPIPSGEYSVCHSASSSLKAGRRVLIAWCGDEPVVVDAIG